MSVDHYSSAVAMKRALTERQVSAVELANMHIDRISALDDTLNAIPVKTFDRTLEMARAADKRLSRGEDTPLLGLPMTLKESTLVAGLPQTAGIPEFRDYLPAQDGPLASKLFASGISLLGKTNIPYALGDWQSDSPVYGRTCNPWNTDCTPGGSTGGGAAALAAGFTPLELGSDIGGSIRVPAAYCGLYGHRPSETAIPKTGAFPMADLPNASFLMGVQGPLARTAGDMILLFEQLAGPEPGEDTAWQLHLPAPRHTALKDFRVAVIPSVLDATASNAVNSALQDLTDLLIKEGASVTRAAPAFDMQMYVDDYIRMLYVMISLGMSPEERKAQIAGLRALGHPAGLLNAEALEMSALDYMNLTIRRAAAQAAWREFYRDYDIVLAPITRSSAFPHTTGNMYERKLLIDNTEVDYFSNIYFPLLAIFTGLPSTTFPAGLDDRQMPIGLQAIGPYLEDRTTLEFARLLEPVWHKFQAPPDYR
ncbi:MAG: hypothetical protein KDI36_05370 [Pseudomonadales bacterium]|nr:hypothetical protein [Pseudomonadales bacterium]